METILIGEVSEVWIGDGLTDRPDVLPERAERRRVAVLTQPPVARFAAGMAEALERGGLASAVRTVPDGEAAKTLGVVESSCEWLNGLGMTRYDTILAVGGGALTDLAGFVGAIYLRGLETVYVPTTLLGAVDAAIGGKTAVNVGAKNLAGVFRHPARVVIDVAVLAGLPERLLREGAAEVIKAGFIGDPELVRLYEAHGLSVPLAEVVSRAVAVKAAVVNEDFNETGRRAVLNFGHTVGHAVELVAGIPHGAAVAIGMTAAAAASERVTGFPDASRVRDVLQHTGLPVQAPTVPPELVLRALELDKKRGPDEARMVLLRSVGDPIVTNVDGATVYAALHAVGIE